MVTWCASRPPAADLTPSLPPGIRTVTRVSGRNPATGVNVSWVGLGRLQWPGTPGVISGVGESGASGAENGW